MNRFDIPRFLSYTVAVVVAGFGISILLGWVPIGVDPPMRQLFGAVLVLMALYRFVMAKIKADSLRHRNGRSDEGNRFLFFLVLAVSVSASGCKTKATVEEQTQAAPQLIVCVAESHTELIQKEAFEFCRSYPKARVTVRGATTREAFIQLLSDSVQMVITDRRMNLEEQEAAQQAELQVKEIRIAEGALAVIVNALNGLAVVSHNDLEDIVFRKVTDWSHFPQSGLMGPIAVAMTGPNSGAYELLQRQFVQSEADLVPAIVPRSENEVLEYTASHPHALGFVSVACLNNQQQNQDTTAGTVRALAFTGFDSTGAETVFELHQANIHWGRYPLHYPVFIYLDEKDSGLAGGFVFFLTNAYGQKIILDWGLVPATMPVRIVQLS